MCFSCIVSAKHSDMPCLSYALAAIPHRYCRPCHRTLDRADPRLLLREETGPPRRIPLELPRVDGDAAVASQMEEMAATSEGTPASRCS